MTDDQSPRRDGDAIGDPGALELGPEIDALLADPAIWDEPRTGLEDDIVRAIESEAYTGPVGGEPPRRRPGWVRPALLGAAAVIAILVGGVVVFSALGGSSGTEEFSAELVPTGLIDGVEGSVEIRSFDSGLQVDLDAPNLPRRDGGRYYEGWLRTVDGTLVPVGTFHEGADVTLWAGIEADRVVAFTITLEVAEAPDSTEHGSSGEVVLKADLGG